MKLAAFLLSSAFIAIGAFDIWMYTHSLYLGGATFMVGEGLILGMLAASMQ